MGDSKECCGTCKKKVSSDKFTWFLCTSQKKFQITTDFTFFEAECSTEHLKLKDNILNVCNTSASSGRATENWMCAEQVEDTVNELAMRVTLEFLGIPEVRPSKLTRSGKYKKSKPSRAVGLRWGIMWNEKH